MPPTSFSKKSIEDIDLKTLCESRPQGFHQSPRAWEDQVLYFLMLDRFSDGKENCYLDNDNNLVSSGQTQPYIDIHNGNAVSTPKDAERWRSSGSKWVGGTLKGLESKIGYLRRLGITAVWISPIFKQVSFQETYHGYGIQNFIDVDSHFGTRDDLKSLIDTAHKNGIYVILDIILNHSGNIFAYVPNRYPAYDSNGYPYMDPRWDGALYDVKGFNDKNGSPGIPFTDSLSGNAGPDDAVWPKEFQNPDHFTRKGHISNWDYDPEYLQGDFCDLKDIDLGFGPVDHYYPSPALKLLCRAYKFWIAFADIDGFRVDTVKHIDKGAARYFTSVIHEFTQSIGKERFYLIAEITGGRKNAFTTLQETGMDAALGISDIPGKMEGLVKGYVNPEEYFDLFRNSLLIKKESHVWFRNRVVTVLDDHDQVRKGNQKARFCALDSRWPKLVVNAMAINTLTMGIPCIYYGTEQCFDGEGGNDRYLREAMFGGEFGAFRSRNHHFFKEDTRAYLEISRILKVRSELLPLKRGRQYLRQISGNGIDFDYPRKFNGRMLSIVPWSRIFSDVEVLCAINTDPDNEHAAWVIVDKDLHDIGTALTCRYSSNKQLEGITVTVELHGESAAVWLTVPAAGCVIYA